MDIFVTKNSEVKVNVFVWTEGDTVSASNLEEEIPKNVETKVVKFVFRRPTYKDSSRIMRKAKINNVGISEQGSSSNLSVDVVGMQDEMLRSQLVKIIYDGKEVPANSETVDNLEPAVARAAISAVFDKVGI